MAEYVVRTGQVACGSGAFVAARHADEISRDAVEVGFERAAPGVETAVAPHQPQKYFVRDLLRHRRTPGHVHSGEARARGARTTRRRQAGRLFAYADTSLRRSAASRFHTVLHLRHEKFPAACVFLR